MAQTSLSRLTHAVLFAAFCALVSIFVAQPAFAWSAHGHMVVCEIAYREMTPDARKELVRLINEHGEYRSFNYSCLFADNRPKARPKEHYLNMPRDQLEITEETCGVNPKCVTSAIADDFAILSDTSEDDVTRAIAMINLGHWVGDVHQPLHVSFADDIGGGHIKKRGTCSSRNLHAVWDDCIIQKQVLGGFSNGWRKYTRAYRAADRLEPRITDVDRENWNESEPWEWAAESYEITLNPDVGYCLLEGDECWYSDVLLKYDGNEDHQRTIQIDDGYIIDHYELVELRLMQAGVRLANLLNQALNP